jgi:hypothetical protein
MKRNPKPVTTATKETLDNGIMVKRVERLVDAEEIYRERSRKHSEENKQSVGVSIGKP